MTESLIRQAPPARAFRVALNMRVGLLALQLLCVGVANASILICPGSPRYYSRPYDWNPVAISTLETSALVIHGRVTRRLMENSAEILVIESFKGASGTKTLVLSENIPKTQIETSRSRFAVGEDFLFISDDGLVVGPCGVRYLDQEFMQALRQHAKR